MIKVWVISVIIMNFTVNLAGLVALHTYDEPKSLSKAHNACLNNKFKRFEYIIWLQEVYCSKKYQETMHNIDNWLNEEIK